MRRPLAWLAALATLSGALPARAQDADVLVVVGLRDELEIAEGAGVRGVVSAGQPEILCARLAEIDPSGLALVVSFGIAGGLHPDLEVGDLLVATRIVSEDRTWAVDPALLASIEARASRAGEALELRRGIFAGSDGIAAGPAESAALRERTGADAVDNESHLAAEFAAVHGLAFGAIRAISDPADRVLPPAALLPLLPDGSGDWKGVLGSLLRQPSQLPDLISTARGYFTALGSLRALRRHVDLGTLAAGGGGGLAASGPRPTLSGTGAIGFDGWSKASAACRRRHTVVKQVALLVAYNCRR